MDRTAVWHTGVTSAYRTRDGGQVDPTDIDRPNLARAMNYLGGGAANFAADRRVVDEILRLDPDAALRARASQSFLARALREALDRGHDQFLDLGVGIPTTGGLHTLVQATDPGARVLYVDHDPVAVAHWRDLLGAAGTACFAVTHADLLDVPSVLRGPEARDTLDLDRPVTVVCTNVLQWVVEDTREAFAHYRDALAPGSLLVVAHPGGAATSHRRQSAVDTTQVRDGLRRLREPDELRRDVAGWEILPPGIVDVVDWPRATVTGRADCWGFCAVRP